MDTQQRDYPALRKAVAESIVAIRRITELTPVGGSNDKVFPPTYQDGPNALEERLVREPDGSLKRLQTVLLDSVQSQANHVELALLRGWRQGKLKFPLLVVDFAAGETDPAILEIGQISALEAPHRIADAILRDLRFDGVDFRKSPAGRCPGVLSGADIQPGNVTGQRIRLVKPRCLHLYRAPHCTRVHWHS
jgi:CRISPR-associated protein Csb1